MQKPYKRFVENKLTNIKKSCAISSGAEHLFDVKRVGGATPSSRTIQKVFLKNGQRILKAPDSRDKNLYLNEINKALTQ